MDRQGIFIFLLTLHILGDYYLQSDAMSKGKRGSFAKTLEHALIYSLPFLLIFLTFRSAGMAFLSSIALHGIIDGIKFLLERHGGKGYLRKLRVREIYIADQMLHVGSLYLVAKVFSPELTLRVFPKSDLLPVFVWCLSLLLIFKPVNVTFKILFSRFSPKENSPASVQGAGASIGSLERILMLLFLAMGQYASVGLIMTAKSIARYDRISKDPVFAEYYLIGTLFSVLATLIIHLSMTLFI